MNERTDEQINRETSSLLELLMAAKKAFTKNQIVPNFSTRGGGVISFYFVPNFT